MDKNSKRRRQFLKSTGFAGAISIKQKINPREANVAKFQDKLLAANVDLTLGGIVQKNISNLG